MIKRGMIIDCNLEPTLGSENVKVRSCIVVTNDVYNSILPIVQVIPITAWNEKTKSASMNSDYFKSLS